MINTILDELERRGEIGERRKNRERKERLLDFIVPKGKFFFTSQYITYVGRTPTDNKQRQIKIYTDQHKHLHRVGLGVIYLGLLLSAVMAAGTRLLP